MQYRRFGNDYDVSVLGFGAMRMPTVGGTVDEPEAIRMIRYAIDHGVNYMDTAYMYHGGQSEVVVGKALLDGYRRKTRVATKYPLISETHSKEKFFDTLHEQLKRLQTDHIDYYMFHAIDGDRWPNAIVQNDLLSAMEQAKRDGKIGHIGFSYHDDADTFIKVVDGYDKWDFCQVQYNYMDTRVQAGTRGVEYAHSKGLPVIVMEPVKGGKLAKVPPSVADVMNRHSAKRSPVEWALDFVWNRAEVTLLLSGMSSMEQLKENISYAEKARPGMLSQGDLEMLQAVEREFQRLWPVPCTGCGYCMPCPSDVDIPTCFESYNGSYVYDLEICRDGYKWLEGYWAAQCTQCKRCEKLCPQHIAISELMPKVHARLVVSD